MDKPIKHCYWVEPGELLAGEYPRNADDRSSPAKIAALENAGVGVFVDLTEEGEQLAPYSDLLSDGSAHLRFPIEDVSVPDSAEFMKTILDAVDENIAAGKIVYVHCWGGVGRTGVVVGCWLARHGLGGEAALERLAELWRACPKSAIRRDSPETPEQKRFILEWRVDQ